MVPIVFQFYAVYKTNGGKFDAFFINTKVQYFPVEPQKGDYIDVEKNLLPIIDIEESGNDKDLICKIFEDKDSFILVDKDREWINVNGEWVLLIELSFGE
jgi:hypothetical protein